MKPPIDVNKPADTGNTPLHAAANVGHFKCVQTLLNCGPTAIDVNVINPQCENATPLHLAVMHGESTFIVL